jgi:hypothetical protein
MKFAKILRRKVNVNMGIDAYLLMEIMNLSKEVPPKKHLIPNQKMKIRLNSKQN